MNAYMNCRRIPTRRTFDMRPLTSNNSWFSETASDVLVVTAAAVADVEAGLNVGTFILELAVIALVIDIAVDPPPIVTPSVPLP
jgi:hypothetical protein